MNRVVFDASAVAALILGEPGSAPVEKARTGALITTVNACEVIETLLRRGDALDEAIEALRDLQLDPVPFTLDLAAVAASLKAPTRNAGLSLGDRACLALALRENIPVLTADRDWLKVDVGVDVQLIR